jgi:hypothetical protein
VLVLAVLIRISRDCHTPIQMKIFLLCHAKSGGPLFRAFEKARFLLAAASRKYLLNFIVHQPLLSAQLPHEELPAAPA